MDFEEVITVILGVLMGVIIVAGAATLTGTILWLIWPVAIPAVFPGLVFSGVISARLSWWSAVFTVWVFGILFRSSNTTTNKKKDD